MLGIARVDTCCRHDESVSCFHYAGEPTWRALGGYDAYRLITDRRFTICAGDHAAFGFAHDLARDDQNVAIAKSSGAVCPGCARELGCT